MRGVLAADTGTPKMREIAAAIQEGAVAFLRRQFRAIGIIVVPLAVLIFFTATKVTRPNGTDRPVLRRGRASSGSCASWPGRTLSGTDRLHRDEPGRAGQRPHRGRGPRRQAARGAQGGLPHRRHHRACCASASDCSGPR